jgi:hypothetical protein
MKASLTVGLAPRIATRLVPALRGSSTPCRGQGGTALQNDANGWRAAAPVQFR